MRETQARIKVPPQVGRSHAAVEWWPRSSLRLLSLIFSSPHLARRANNFRRKNTEKCGMPFAVSAP
jgi:hypothetical protein